MGLDRQIYHQAVAEAATVIHQIQALRATFPISLIVLGDQTGSQTWKTRLASLENAPNIVLVDERYSSLAARERYWQMYPPQGWQRLLPQGLRSIPRPIDDIVAILLIERYLARLTHPQTPKNC
jgi:hypothetical protein